MPTQMAAYLKDAIAHLERAQAGSVGTDVNLLYTLGRLYIANDESAKAVQARALIGRTLSAGRQPQFLPSSSARSSAISITAEPT